MCVTHFIHLRHEGDLVWLNNECFKVERIVHTYTASTNQDKPNSFPPEIWLTDASSQDRKRYPVLEPHDWNRDDSIEEFVKK
jgi:hypothetical protein